MRCYQHHTTPNHRNGATIAMAMDDSTHLPDPGKTRFPFVASDPAVALRGYGAGEIAAFRDFRMVAVLILPSGPPTVRLLIKPSDALLLARQLTDAAAPLTGGADHA
jgi:hypothetical protein